MNKTPTIILLILLLILTNIAFLSLLSNSNNKQVITGNPITEIPDQQELTQPINPIEQTLEETAVENINLELPEGDEEEEIPQTEPTQPQEPTSTTIKVTSIIDGDTIEIQTGQRIRLICIDTPETGETGYSEAKDYVEDLLLNKQVRLEKDISETDRYGRLLRYIYLQDNTFVNELIVKNGYGSAYPYDPDTELCPIIEQAEDYAREHNLGIWVDYDQDEIICNINYYNCGDFDTQSEAQNVFDFCGGVGNDIHWLDGDGDGVVCEGLQ